LLNILFKRLLKFDLVTFGHTVVSILRSPFGAEELGLLQD
jgi:hypothetical protein